MRHRNFGTKLGRNHNQRQALFKGLAKSLFTYGHLETTESKAKAALPLVENICTKAMSADLNKKRQLFAIFQDQAFVNQLVSVMQSTFTGQKGNFIKLIRVHRRQGDDALIVKMTFVKPVSFLPQKIENAVKTEVKPVKEVKTKTSKTKKP